MPDSSTPKIQRLKPAAKISGKTPLKGKGIAYYITYPEYQAKTMKGTAFPTGHAGVLFVDENGNTRYREYGRYANKGMRDAILGRVNDPVEVPDVEMHNGVPTRKSLNQVFRHLSKSQYGNPAGAITAHPYDVKDIAAGLGYADSLYAERKNPLRKQDGHKYAIMSNNCSTFANECINRAGGNAPTWGLKHILPVANTWLNSKDIEYNTKK